MVAKDHILGYYKNILRSFRQNVLGIERVLLPQTSLIDPLFQKFFGKIYQKYQTDRKSLILITSI